MKIKFINISVLSLCLLWGGVLAAFGSDNISTTPVYLQNDGTYTDKDNNKIDPSLVIKKYERVNVKKYFDADKNIYVDEKDKVEGVNYKEVEVTETKLSYYILNKMEYTQPGLSEGAPTSKIDYTNVSYNYQKEYGHKTTSATQEVKYFKWNNENGLKLEDGSKDSHDLAYYVDSNRKASGREVTKPHAYPPQEATLGTGKDYIGLVDNADSGQPSGGAIYNSEKNQGILSGDFINNSAVAKSESGSYTSATGGAIYNSYAEIEGINGNFIGNHVNTRAGVATAGALYNHGKIGDIKANFIGNYVQGGDEDFTITSGNRAATGGAIYLQGNQNGTTGVKSITGNFIGNYAYAKDRAAEGGAISNWDKITENLEGDFIGNYAKSSKNVASGGAIYLKDPTASLEAYIGGDIIGKYIGNSAISEESNAFGGAIYNEGTIRGNIKSDFIANSAETVKGWIYGGAIYNKDEITGNIEGNFIQNSAKATNNIAFGGAIYNYKADGSTKGLIGGDIIGKYIENSAISENESANGGAIYNYGTVNGKIDADFIKNSAKSAKNNTYGGAIYNYGTVNGGISGDFIENLASSQDKYTRGGAIYNAGTMKNGLVGDFTGNSIEGIWSLGGAIYNSGTIDDAIVGDFIANNALSTKTNYAQGGAIYNAGTISEIKNSSFFDNYVETVTANSNTRGGAIYSTKDLNITADDNKTSEFSGNYVKNGDTKTDNAIYMGTANTTLNLKANENGKIIFKDSIAGNANGYNINILSNDGTGSVLLHNNIQNANLITDNILVDFADGKVKDYNILSLSAKNDSKFKIDLSFKENGGLGASDKFIISNADKSSGIIKLDKINFVDTVEDGKTYTVEIIEADNSNVKLELGADVITKGEVGNTVYSDTIVAEPDAINVVSTNGKTDNAIAITGKVYNSLDLINASNDPDRNFIFKEGDSYTVTSDLSTTGAGILNVKGTENNLSAINGNDKTLFNLENETTLNLNNVKITGAKVVATGSNDLATINVTDSEISNNTQGIKTAAKVNIYGASTIKNNGDGIDTTSAITLDAQGKTMNIDDNLKGSEISIKNGSVNLYKGVTSPETVIENANVAFKDDTVLNGTNLTINKSADNSLPTLNFTNDATGAISYNTLTLKNDINMKVDVDLAKETMDTISAKDFINVDGYKINVSDIILLSDALKDETSIQFADENLKNSVTTSVKEVAYSPVYKYDVEYNKDNGEFNFIRGNASGSDGYADLNPSVLAAPVTANVSGYLNQLQAYDEAFYAMDKYMMLPKMQRFALKANARYAISEPTPYLYEEENHASGWLRPYTTIEKVKLKKGPKVDNIAYGSYFGGETSIKNIGKGWEHQWGTYAGYNGSRQKYSGISMHQNGGTFGVTSNLYKGNFFQGLTVNAGGSGIYANTFNGNDTFAMLTSGVATKFGYNTEFNDGRFILQPSYLMSYSFINTTDYTDSLGVKVNSNPLHAVHIEPGLKLILNSKSGWQSYLGGSMIFNIMNGSDYKINDIALEDMSIKPFAKYGLGIRKTENDGLGGFLQAYATSGGRNGIGMQGGLNWAIGKKRKEKL